LGFPGPEAASPADVGSSAGRTIGSGRARGSLGPGWRSGPGSSTRGSSVLKRGPGSRCSLSGWGGCRSAVSSPASKSRSEWLRARANGRCSGAIARKRIQNAGGGVQQSPPREKLSSVQIASRKTQPGGGQHTLAGQRVTSEKCSGKAKDGRDAKRVSRLAPGFGDDMTGRDGLLLESERGCAAAGWLL
jgi:hypothetical protein